MFGFIPRERDRQMTHLVCISASLLGWGLTAYLLPDLPWYHTLTDATGYISLLLVVITLLIGPLKLLAQKRNPVNFMLRRDTGIWAGITGIVHTAAGLQVHMGGDIQMYFFENTPQYGLRLLTNLFGLSNDIGLLATLLLAVLLVISNDLSLRWLRGPVWKWIQRSNYILVVLIIVHTIGYQLLIQRAPIMTWLVAGLVLATLIMQAFGITLYLMKNRRASLRESAREQGD